MRRFGEEVEYFNQTYQEPLEVDLYPGEEEELRGHLEVLTEIDGLN